MERPEDLFTTVFDPLLRKLCDALEVEICALVPQEPREASDIPQSIRRIRIDRGGALVELKRLWVAPFAPIESAQCVQRILIGGPQLDRAFQIALRQLILGS